MNNINDKDEFVLVSFICPTGREKEAEEILTNMGLKDITTCLPTSTIFIGKGNEPDKKTEGTEFMGIAKLSEVPKLMNALTKVKIAGYSRETRIMCSKVTDKKE